MPTYQAAVDFECQAPPHTIRLIQSGEFFRAYNHSAWLFTCCIAEHKVIRKYVKALKEDIFYIGFPSKSLFSNIGERQSTKTEYGFDILLGDDERPDEAGFESWKLAVEADHSSKADYLALPLAGADAEREVIRRIKEFPLENKSMVDCVVFLSELRRLLSPN